MEQRIKQMHTALYVAQTGQYIRLMQTESLEITKAMFGVRMHTVNGAVILEMFARKTLTAQYVALTNRVE